MKIHQKHIGKGFPTFIVAEAGINHNGDIELAKDMISTAAKIGVDGIKFQTIFPEELFSEKNNLKLFNLIKKWSFTKKEHLELKRLAEKMNIEFFSTPVGLRSAKLLKDIKCRCIKIASGEITNHELIEYVAKLKIPMIISTGMTTISEIFSVVELVKQTNTPFSILHCNSSYPTHPNDVNLVNIPYFQKLFDVPIGYSDHTIGNETCLAAVTLGASIIEKHFTLNKNFDGPDQKLSADPSDFKDLVQKIRLIEKSLGKLRTGPTTSEKKFRQLMRKSIVSKTDIPSGSKLTRKMVTFLRPGNGMPPYLMNQISGITTKKRIPKDTVIDWNMF